MPRGIAKQSGTCSRCGQPFVAFRDEISWGGGSLGKHYPSCPAKSDVAASQGLEVVELPAIAQPELTPVASPDDVPSCEHGTRIYRSGISKRGRKWAGWFCPIKSSGCEPTWVHSSKKAANKATRVEAKLAEIMPSENVPHYKQPVSSLPANSGNPLMDAILQTIQPHILSKQDIADIMAANIGGLLGSVDAYQKSVDDKLSVVVAEMDAKGTAINELAKKFAEQKPASVSIDAGAVNSILDSRLRELNKTEIKQLAENIVSAVDLSNIPEYIAQNGEIETLTAIVKCGKNAGIKGPTGCGKTQLVLWVAKLLGAELYEVVGDGGVMREEVIGSRGYNGKETYWQDGTVTRALRRSKDRLVILYIDEPNRLREDIQGSLFPVMDDRKRLVLSENGGEVLQGQASRNFGAGLVVISSWNEGYRGTNVMDEALNNRYELGFTLSYLPQDREIKLLVDRTGVSMENAKTIVNVATTLRQAGKEKRIKTPISTRSLIAWADVVSVGGFNMRSAGEMALVEQAESIMENEKKIIRDTIHAMTRGGVSA